MPACLSVSLPVCPSVSLSTEEAKNNFQPLCARMVFHPSSMKAKVEFVNEPFKNRREKFMLIIEAVSSSGQEKHNWWKYRQQSLLTDVGGDDNDRSLISHARCRCVITSTSRRTLAEAIFGISCLKKMNLSALNKGKEKQIEKINSILFEFLIMPSVQEKRALSEIFQKKNANIYNFQVPCILG